MLVNVVFPTLHPTGRNLRAAAVIHQREAVDSILVVFSDIYIPFSYLMTSMKGSPQAIRFIFGIGKLERPVNVA